MSKCIAPDLQQTIEHTIQNSHGKLQTELSAHLSRLYELEQHVSRLEEENETLTVKLQNTDAEKAHVNDKMEELENKSRHNRLIGLPESVKIAELQRICKVYSKMLSRKGPII